MFKSSSKTVMSRVFKNKNEVTKPEIYIMEKTLLQFKAYCDSCAKEIGWLAFVRKDGNKYIIYDTILPKQEVTSVTTELTEQGLQDISEEILMTRPDEFNNIRCWCHSHVNMAVFPSGTDEETFEQFYQNCEYFIRIICNKKEEIRIDFVDLEQEVRFDNIEWSFYTMEETEEKYVAIENYKKAIAQAQEEIKKLNADITKAQADVYKNIKGAIEVDVKKKLVEEKPKYKYNTPYSNFYSVREDSGDGKLYNAKVNYNDAYTYGYDDYYTTTSWHKLSQKEKEEYCLLSSITLLDSSVEGPYLEYKDPEELLTTAEYVKLLEVSTIGELKSLLKHKDFASNYTEDDWTSLYEEVEYFGIIAIEEEMERMVSNYGY